MNISEMERRLEEAQEHAQETGRTLQYLMDAVNSQPREAHPLPVPANASTSATQQTISAQRQIQWHQNQGMWHNERT